MKFCKISIWQNLKCTYLDNYLCIARRILIDFNLDKLHYYQFTGSLHRCDRSCNTADDLCAQVCVLNEMEDKNLKVFNTIIGINEWKTLIKHIACNCRCKFEGKKCTSKHIWNNYKCKNSKNNVDKIKIMIRILAYAVASVIKCMVLMNT